VGELHRESRRISVKNMAELLKFLEKEYGENWYEKVAFDFITRDNNSAEIEVSIWPIRESSVENLLEELTKLTEHTRTTSLEDMADLEKSYAEPSISVDISEDEMKAFVTVIPGLKRHSPTVEEVLAALREAGVSYGIDESQVQKAISKEFFKPVLVASGKDPIPSTDASVKYLFPETGIDFFVAKDTEHAFDPAFAYQIHRCDKDSVLARKTPPKEGQDGMTVTGKTVKVSKAKDVNLSSFLGENTRISEDGTEILANCDGQPVVKDGKIHVRKTIVIDGDLGYKTGNVDFNGSVVIRGNAEGPFRVRAQGDILIFGVLGEIELSCGGSLRVQGGVFARGKGKIRVEKDFFAKFVNEAQIVCNGNVAVEDYIMNSTLIVGGNVIIAGRGVLSGGVVKSRKNVDVGELGGESGVKTEVTAGVDYEKEVKLLELNKQLESFLRSLSLISQIEISILNRINKKEQVSENQEKLLGFYRKRKRKIQEEIQRTYQAMSVLTHTIEAEKLMSNARIKVRRVCREGCQIAIAGASTRVKERLTTCEFYFNKRSGKVEVRFP